MKKLIRYLNIYLIPFALMIVGTYLLQMLTQKMEVGIARAAIYAVLGLAISVGVFFLISDSLKKLSMKPMVLGSYSSLLWGALIGLSVSFASGIGFGLANGYSLNFGNILTNLHINVLANAFPALCEEIVFRGGIVEATLQIYGKFAGLGAGSAPFGILHFVGIFFGNNVTVAQYFGISLAGLMLSLVYLRFGVYGSFACHLVWNSLVSGWIKVYGTTDKSVISALEGSWLTCIVLAMTCVMLFFSLKKNRSW